MSENHKRMVPCPECRRKTMCDCDICFGSGRIEHPRDVAKREATLRATVAGLERERDGLREALAEVSSLGNLSNGVRAATEAVRIARTALGDEANEQRQPSASSPALVPPRGSARSSERAPDAVPSQSDPAARPS